MASSRLEKEKIVHGLSKALACEIALRSLLQIQAQQVKDRSPKFIEARVGISSLRCIQIRLEFGTLHAGVRIRLKTKRPLLYPLFRPEMSPSKLVEDFWTSFEKNTFEQTGHIPQMVPGFVYRFLHWATNAIYLSLFNFIVFASVLLFSAVTTRASELPSLSTDHAELLVVPTGSTMLSAYLIVAVCFAVFTGLFIRLHKRVVRVVLPDWRKLVSSPIENDMLTKALTDTSARMKLECPTLVLRPELFSPAVYTIPGSPHGGKATTLVLSKYVLEVLTHDELASALAHELYHVKHATTHLFVQRVGVPWLLATLLFYVAIPFTVVLLMRDVLLKLGPNVFLVVPLLTLLPSAFLIMGLLGEIAASFPATRHNEFHADWAASLLYGQPLTMLYALHKVNAMEHTGSVDVANATIPQISQKHLLNLEKTLRPHFFRNERIDERISILFALDRILNSSIQLQIVKKPSFGFRQLVSQCNREPERIHEISSRTVESVGSILKEKLSLTDFDSRLAPLGDENLRKMYEYALMHQESFALRSCASYLGVDLELALYGMLALVLGQAIRVLGLEGTLRYG